MISLPPPRVLYVVLLIAVSLVVWQLGYRSGTSGSGTSGGSPTDVAAAMSAVASNPELAAAVQTNTATEDTAALLKVALQERDVARAVVVELQNDLKTRQMLSDADQSELALYRRIASDATATGLSVDSIVHKDGQLAITLIQSRGRKRVSGGIGIALNRQKQDQTERLLLATADDDTAVRFDFRFFETIMVPIDSAAAFKPDALQITINPDGNRFKSFKSEYDWADIPNS